jgi:hypothetical protein
MKATVQSGQLQFTRDGRTLVVAEPDAVTLVELRGDARRRIAIPGVQAVAAFADQVWVATRTGALIRLTGDGRPLDEHALPIDADGLLIPTTIGGPAALWTGGEPVMLVDDLGTLATIPSHGDTAIPIAGRRFARYAGPRLTLPAGTAVTLASGAQIAGGSVVFEGTSLALVAEHPRGRDIIVLALASGRILQTLALPPGTVRIAARRGLAVVHDAARRLAIIDLRFARHLGAVVTDDDVTDVAIDPDGGLLAVRLAGGDLELAPIGERMGAAARQSASLRDASDRDGDASKLEPTEVAMSGLRPRASCPSSGHPRPSHRRLRRRSVGYLRCGRPQPGRPRHAPSRGRRRPGPPSPSPPRARGLKPSHPTS